MTLVGTHARHGDEVGEAVEHSAYLSIPSDGPSSAESGLVHLTDAALNLIVRSTELDAHNPGIENPDKVRDLIRQSLESLGMTEDLETSESRPAEDRVS